MKLSTKMLLGTAALAVTPIVITSLLVGGGAVQLSRDSLTQAVQGQLVSLREIRKQQVSEYFGSLASALRALASNAALVEGHKAMRQSFGAASDGLKPEVLKQFRDDLRGVYTRDFAGEFAKRNPQPPAGVEAMVDALDPAALALQHAFIVANPNPLGSKNKMVEPSERSAYGAAHARAHPSIEGFREKFGFYDIFLVDTQTDRIVYTAFKEFDFATSLADGPAAKSGLGEVYRKAKAAKADTVVMSDYQPYFISYNDQAAFMAVPILEGDRAIGVLAAQIPLTEVTRVMSAGREWKKQGQGDSGETYLVGTDLLMRTDSRFLLEDKAGFLKSLAGKVDAAQLAVADKKSTSIGVVKVDTAAAREAAAGRSGFELVTDYRGVGVFSAFGPVEIFGVRFGLLAEIDEEEALAGATELRRQTILRTLVVALGILAVAGLGGYLFVRSITRPVNRLSNVVAKVAAGDDEVRSDVRTGDEIQQLGDTFNKLLDERIAALRKAEQENETLNNSVVGLLRTMYELSQRNLTVRAEVTPDVVGTVADSVNLLATATSSALTDVSNVATEVATTSDRVNSNTAALSEQALRDRIAAQEMTNDILLATQLMRDVAALAEQSRDAAGAATDTTLSALKAVTSTVGEMSEIRESIGEMEKRIKRLGERSQEISQVVTVINSLSERTHVLALNASMQAAMAGEAGRGFAVVTEEVQRLADASRSATMQIAQLAQNIQLETTETVAALNRTVAEVVDGSEVAESSGTQMRETEAATAKLAQAVQRIAAESARQLELAGRLAQRADSILKSTEQTELVVKTTSSDAASLAQASSRLVKVVSEFKLEDATA